MNSEQCRFVSVDRVLTVRYQCVVDDAAHASSRQNVFVCVSYSFRCGIEYHAPTDCDVIKKWLTKCADDSETANYISAHTKDVSMALYTNDWST